MSYKWVRVCIGKVPVEKEGMLMIDYRDLAKPLHILVPVRYLQRP
ncbi:hypothetical protein APHCRT_0836 [Anaplasma phagocytophilum str. CRT53-1]|nr:hypothetical protein APHCRT_0836 [Anaplasma phagocytophilum str. CRT53-1]